MNKENLNGTIAPDVDGENEPEKLILTKDCQGGSLIMPRCILFMLGELATDPDHIRTFGSEVSGPQQFPNTSLLEQPAGTWILNKEDWLPIP